MNLEIKSVVLHGKDELWKITMTTCLRESRGLIDQLLSAREQRMTLERDSKVCHTI